LNAAETWVDILGTADQNVVSSIVNFVSGSTTPPQVDSHFMSESGIIDTFFMLGPKPKDVFRQYSKLTGTAPLPQASINFCFANMSFCLELLNHVAVINKTVCISHEILYTQN
jgi:alpha-glucosidase (family GH31 glycosyl hydrolase)